jgi:hypothetical protein
MEHLELLTGPVVAQLGTLATGSPTVTGLVTAELAGAVQVRGPGIPPSTFVHSIDDGGQVTLTRPATATGPQSLNFTLQPITLAEAKQQCRLEIPDDDSLIVSWIDSARLRAEVLLRATILQSTFNWYMDGFPASANGYYNRLIRQSGPNPQWLPNGAAILHFPTRPLISVASVKYFDPLGVLQTIDPATYFVSTGLGARIQPLIGYVWPVARPQIDGVVIQFTAGNPTAAGVSENVKSACRLMVAHWYEHREEVADAQTYPVPQAVDALISATDPGVYA